MKKYDVFRGFTTERVTDVKEIDATLVELCHDKSGCKLIFLDREDSNKTFAIGFRTVPTDDTGVFHILEHSVLCGSRRFPVKDPFTELIKGSITTFLNAMTYGEKTIYPVSSKNDKALLGLVDVYLDAVLHPLALENPLIFMQEGHRYELADGELTVNGVVYNEMKGAYSSADEYADSLLNRLMSPGGTYSYDSGGSPDAIPSLTYEEFCAAHEKFYHPSNAIIFLDGSVNLDEILPLIDGYLSEYERKPVSVEISDGSGILTEPLVATYPIEKEDDESDKGKIYLAHDAYAHCERYKTCALALAAEAIADSNNAVLTKKILDTDLCESFSFYPTRSYKTNALNVKFSGVKDGKEQELIAAYDAAISEILRDGLPRQSLAAALSRTEFGTRESDFGMYPKGMVYMDACMEAAFLGEAPSTALEYDELFDFLREKLDTDYYDSLLSEVLSTPRATLVLHPDKHFTEKKDAELKDKLAAVYSNMSNSDRERILKASDELAVWQETPDTAEALASIPALTTEDLNCEPERVPTEVYEEDGVTVISHPISTVGISYPELYFEASDVDVQDVPYVRLFADMISEWDTELNDVTAFRNNAKTELGSLYMRAEAIKRGEDVKLYLTLRLSCLETKRQRAAELMQELLYLTKIDGEELLKKNLKQMYTASVERFTARGDSYAIRRDSAKHSRYEALNERLFGYTYHAFLKNLVENADEQAGAILKRLRGIRDKYLRRERLTLAITDEDGSAFAAELISAIKTGGEPSGKSSVTTLEALNEGIAIPSTVSYCARTTNLDKAGKSVYTGAFATLSTLLAYEILWNEIRLKGGAYDTGFRVRGNSGTVCCYTYRDPSPSRSADVFAQIPALLDDFLNTSPNILKYVIGTVGATDTVSTPRSSGYSATTLYLSGKSYDDVARIRRESVGADLECLKGLSGILRTVLAESTVTVAGPREELERIGGIDRILDI